MEIKFAPTEKDTHLQAISTLSYLCVYSKEHQRSLRKYTGHSREQMIL
jgi:hypothetical protein